MKCPECGAWSEVKDTRQNKAKTVVTRRRECANGHLFTTHETIAYTTSAIPYESMRACTNAREEYQLAVGAYQLFKRPTRIIGAICNDSAMGVVE